MSIHNNNNNKIHNNDRNKNTLIEIKYLIHNNKNKIQIYIKNKNKKCGYTGVRAHVFPLVLI